MALRTEIRAIQRQLGITTIYVTHDQEEALSLSDRIVVMNAGRIEQIGTPFQIYNFPQTSFVASFVGTLNVLPARVLDVPTGRLEVEGQSIRTVRAFDPAATGTQVTIALRPESMALDGATADGVANHLTGMIEDTMFLGAIVRVRVRFNERVVAFDTFNHPHLAVPERSQPVTVTFAPEAVLILDDAAPHPG